MIMRISKINNVIDVGCYNINDTNVSNNIDDGSKV